MKLFSILTAAACLLIVSACASTPVPTDERVHVIEVDSATDVQPGNIYVSTGAAKIFTFRDVESEINENGYLAVRVFGKTSELSALKWAFLGDITYEFSYRFLWIDAEGKPVSEPGAYRLRSANPGDPVRFVGHAPTEDVRDFAMVLFLASEQPASDTAEAAEAVAPEEKTNAEAEAINAENEKIRESMPSLPLENVSGDSHDVKTIGVPDSAPSAVPAEKN